MPVAFSYFDAVRYRIHTPAKPIGRNGREMRTHGHHRTVFHEIDVSRERREYHRSTSGQNKSSLHDNLPAPPGARLRILDPTSVIGKLEVRCQHPQVAITPWPTASGQTHIRPFGGAKALPETGRSFTWVLRQFPMTKQPVRKVLSWKSLQLAGCERCDGKLNPQPAAGRMATGCRQHPPFV
jgi:hypothetical protein